MEYRFTFAKVISSAARKPKSALRYARFTLQNFFLMVFVKIKNYNYVGEKGRVTIITPTFNRVDRLKEAIDSVLNQTYSNWEHIIVSDGYDTRVKELIRGYNDTRIRYCSTFKLHISGNYQRNFALKFAKGEFVLYLDDDNLIFQNCLKVMVNGFCSEEIGYVVCPILYRGNIMKPQFPFKWGQIDLLNYMIRRKLIETVWGQGLHFAADFFLISEVTKISKGNYLDECIGHHR